MTKEMLGTKTPRRPSRWIAWVLAAVVALALLAYPVARFVLALFGGDPEPSSIRIVNQTDEQLTIYQVRVDGQRFRLLAVPAHSSVGYQSPCAAAEMVAVASSHRDIATRPDSDECNLSDWIIPSG
jgi:hypothetical protein